MNVNYMEKVSGNKWTDIFESEEEMVEAMMRVNASDHQPHYMIPKGYVYIQSFQRQVANGKTLSDKQMSMLKRLAVNIFKAGKAQKLW